MEDVDERDVTVSQGFDEARVDEESAGILVFFRFEGECWIANRPFMGIMLFIICLRHLLYLYFVLSRNV